MACYLLSKGSTPLLISMPHIGQKIPETIAGLMTEEALLIKDTDWYIDKLYEFAHEIGASIIKPNTSRYVIDLNRGIDGINLYPGADSTELCPSSTFNRTPIYLDEKKVLDEDVDKRIAEYWQPYHDEITNPLAEIKAEFGFAIILDAHSILSTVPRFFEGQLPDFNWGTVNGASCSVDVINSIKKIDFSPYSVVWNDRFKGGYITREYGDPENNIHAIQLELSQRTYMNESEFTFNESLALQVKPILKTMVEALLNCAPNIVVKEAS
jgi:N-formylglutamate deformylase